MRKKRTQSKKHKQQKTSDTSKEHRRIEILIEDVRDDIKLIAEQHGDIKKTLDHHTKILDSHSQILDSHSQQLASHTEMIGSLMTDAAIIKEDVALIKGDLKQKVDWEDFAALERRVALLEKRL